MSNFLSPSVPGTNICLKLKSGLSVQIFVPGHWDRSCPLCSRSITFLWPFLFVLIISWEKKVILIYEHAVWMTVVGPSLLPRSQFYWIALYCTKSGFQCWHSNKCQGDISPVVISVSVRARIMFVLGEMWRASVFHVPSNVRLFLWVNSTVTVAQWPTRDVSAYFCSVRNAVDSKDGPKVQTHYGKQLIKQKSLFRQTVWDMSRVSERLKLRLFLALFFGAVGFLFTLLSCGTEYWLLAAESCSRSEDRKGVSGVAWEEKSKTVKTTR